MMKKTFKKFYLHSLLISAVTLTFSNISKADTVALATAPLASSAITTVKPNVLFILDDSGSMAWDHMPDDANDAGSSVTFRYGYYGLRSSQCNQVYYNPNITYLPPVKADGTNYPDMTFTDAYDNGFSTSPTPTKVNLNTSFRASQSYNGDTINQAAYYYTYAGNEDTQIEKNYNSTTNNFYKECNNSTNASVSATAPAFGAAIGNTGAPASAAVAAFKKVKLSTSGTATIVINGFDSTTVTGITVNGVQLMSATSVASSNSTTVASNVAARINLSGFSATASGNVVTITGPTSAANYVPVVTRGTGSMTFTTDVFADTTASKLTNFANWYSYYRTRMLMMKSSAGRAFSGLNNNYRVGLLKINSSTPTVTNGLFEDTKRSDWYTALYNASPSGSTPLRSALANAGAYYAGKLAGTDPVEYSCQQNFSILSTDGYWNTGSGYQLDESSIGNQDGAAERPMYDGAQANTTVTTIQTRDSFSKVSSSDCNGGRKKLSTQPQKRTCTAIEVNGVTGTSTCGSWSNDGPATVSGSCTNTSAPSATTPVVVSTTRTPGIQDGSSNSLADVAMYYYQTDLRTIGLQNCGTAIAPATVGPLCENNVFVSASDNNTQQHMTTFTLGMGVSGYMNYSSSYLTDTTGDYNSVKFGTTASTTVCTWQAAGTTCNWPLPGLDGSNNGLTANIDDLWHAAVNGRGAYYSATDPTTLKDGLSDALSGISTRKGSAAAAATSTLNPVAGNNSAFVASYTTVQWSGNLEGRGINTDTGEVSEAALWCAEDIPAGVCATPLVAENEGNTTVYYCVTPNAVTCPNGDLVNGSCKVQAARACPGTLKQMVTDGTRNIKTPNTTTVGANAAGTTLINFDAAYGTANPTYFSAAQIGTLSQWTALTPAQQALASANMVDYLRGNSTYEDRSGNANRLFRERTSILGDALESQPAYSGVPILPYSYPGYSNFITSQSAKSTVTTGTVFMGANDGMMHAFAADVGTERWAYVPTMVIPNMWKLADFNYSTLHINLVNGSPIISDVCVSNCTDAGTAIWKTILVAGLNGGGRGYYALDITTPETPQLLWEFTTTAGIGKIKDDDLGYSFANPVITKKADGTWVVIVSSGYNNVSPGDGKGYLYVLNAGTGAIISKISTGVGDTTTPSGLGKIAGWNDEPPGNLIGDVYGGDLQGNVWKFNVNSTATATIGNGSVTKLASLYSDSSGLNPQPITATPSLGLIAQQRVIFVGTGKYLEGSDLTNTQQQSLYAIKDNNTATLVNPRNTLKRQQMVNNANGTGTRVSSSVQSVDFNMDRGWYIDFPDSKERLNIDMRLIQGTLLFATLVPSNGACTPGGYGWLNAVNYRTGTAVENTVSYKYDSTIVGMNVLYVQGEPKVSVVTSADPTPELNENVEFNAAAPSFVGKRNLWRELIPNQ